MHTPGPWKAVQLDFQGHESWTVITAWTNLEDEDDLGIHERGEGIAMVYGGPEHIRANAHVIAAVPDLLKACKAALARWGLHSCTEVKMLADAVTKAEGKEKGQPK